LGKFLGFGIMSEESSSTTLRLKPKLKVGAESAPSATTSKVAPLSSSGESGVENEGGAGLKLKPRDNGVEAVAVAGMISEGQAAVDSRVRLKPRLTVQAEAQPASTVQTPAAIQPPAVIAPPAAAVVPPAAIAGAQDTGAVLIGGFKLRPKTTSDEPPPLPDSVPMASASPGAPPVPAAERQARVKPSPELVKSFSSGNTVSPFPRASKSGRRSALPMVVLLLLVSGGAYYAYATYIAPASSRPVAIDLAPASEDGAEPESLPGRLVGKAQEVVDARAGNLDGLEELGIESRSPAPFVPGSTESGVMASMPVREEVPPEPEPEMSAAFHRFVTEMRVNGVFQGDPPRALVNGRMVRAGEPLDMGLGIVFTGIDAEKHLILMREPSGARATKKY